jgi:hypothetical protein
MSLRNYKDGENRRDENGTLLRGAKEILWELSTFFPPICRKFDSLLLVPTKIY